MISLQQSQSNGRARCICCPGCAASGCARKAAWPPAAGLPARPCSAWSSSRTASCAQQNSPRARHACRDGTVTTTPPCRQPARSACGLRCSVGRATHLEAQRPHHMRLRRPGRPLQREAHGLVRAQRCGRVLERRIPVNEASAALALHQLAPCAPLHLRSVHSMASP